MDFEDDQNLDEYVPSVTSKKKYTEALNKALPVYGDVLKCLNLELGEIPKNVASTLLDAYSLSEEIFAIAEAMLSGFVEYAMLLKGYLLWNKENLAFEIFLDKEKNIGISKKGSAILDDNNIEELRRDIRKSEAIDFVKEKTGGNIIRIILLEDIPEFIQGHIFYWTFDKENFRNVVSQLHKPIVSNVKLESPERILDRFVIVDPILLRVFDSELKDFSKKLEEEVPNVKIVSPSEFAFRHLKLNKERFDRQWNVFIDSVKRDIGTRYPFILLRNEYKIVQLVKENINTARAYLSLKNFDSHKEDIALKAGKGVEGLLNVFATINGITMKDGETMGSLINRLRQEIFEYFDEDTYKDIEFIIRIRNQAAHLNNGELESSDLFKMVRKAELFLDLFTNKFSGKV